MLCLSEVRLQVHASVVSSVIQVKWSWQSAVDKMMKAATAPSGSALDFDAGCNFGYNLPFSVHCISVAVFCSTFCGASESLALA